MQYSTCFSKAKELEIINRMCQFNVITGHTKHPPPIPNLSLILPNHPQSSLSIPNHSQSSPSTPPSSALSRPPSDASFTHSRVRSEVLRQSRNPSSAHSATKCDFTYQKFWQSQNFPEQLAAAPYITPTDLLSCN